MTLDAPEYHTRPTTPLSPLPFHPPQPSKIPVIQNQIDPIFNMMSTHTETTNAAEVSDNPPVDVQVTDHHTDNDVDTVDHASFSDPYEEEEIMAKAVANDQDSKSAVIDDDYAMTFDSDGEEASSRTDVSSANAEQEVQPQASPVPNVIETLPSAALAITSSIAMDGQDSLPHSLPTTSPPTAANVGDAHIADDNNVAMASIETQQSHTKPISYEDVSNGGIDIQQLLDNITATAEANATPTSANVTNANFPFSSSGLPAHSSLPPRPQITQKPSMHPAYATQDDIRKYHTGAPGYPPPPGISSHRPPGVSTPFVAAGAPGTAADARNALPPPPPASFQPSLSQSQPSVVNLTYPQTQRIAPRDRPTATIEAPDPSDEGEVTWEPNVQKLYDEFLADERMYVNEGLWDRFPVGSRLFIGNLPTEKVTKRDLFYAFYKYGRLAQISIKQAYGFVQFHDAAACHTAIDREQGQEIRGRKMHLEISKPQKNTRGAGSANVSAATPRRSRSPDNMRGVDRGVRGINRPPRGGGYDHYDARSGVSPRDSEFRGPLRARDDYRPIRSPSPPQRDAYRSRDDFGPSRGREYYDGRDRRRSRSRSPYGRRDGGRYRERSPSPRKREADADAELQIPHRDPRDVPDVQIILMDELDRGFVSWVESEIRARGIKTDVMHANPRNPIDAVIRRQILEGVLAVIKLTRRSQDTSKTPLQVFDRKGGADNVRFDEYQDLEPKIAGELILRAKQTQAPVAPYQQPQVAASQAYQQPPIAAAAVPNLANLVGQLDNATLHQLLGTLNAAPTGNAPPAALPIDLAGILGGLAQPQPPQQQNHMYQVQQNPNPYASVGNDTLASLLGNTGQAQAQPQQQSAQQVQNIMAQLAKFRQ